MRISKAAGLLGTVMGLALLAGCAQSPHYLQVDPQVDQDLPRVGNGQPVTFEVRDERESDVLGTRSGAAMSSAVISVESEDLLPRLRKQTTQALRRMGFEPTSEPAEGRPSLTLSLAELSYVKSDVRPLVDKARLLARFRAAADNAGETYTGTYTAKREQDYAVTPDRATNTNMVTDLLARALNRAFKDPQVSSLLAR